MILRAFAVWLLMLGIAVVCGAARDRFLAPRMGADAARAFETVLGVAVFVAVIFSTIRWIEPDLERGKLLALGVGWTLATVAFEFGMGLAMQKTWPEMLADYNLLAGRLWVLVLLALLVTPSIAGRVLGVR